MHLKWKIFIGLIILAVIFIVFAYKSPDATFGEWLYKLIIFPAAIFSLIGLPTLVPSYFLSGLTTLGFVLDVIVYLLLFYFLAWLAVWVKNKMVKK